jgi:hypothetical protein
MTRRGWWGRFPSLSHPSLVSQQTLKSLPPTQHSQRPERVPPARLTHRFTARKGERFVVRAIEEPSTVSLPPVFDEKYGIAKACVGLDIGCPEVVERA